MPDSRAEAIRILQNILNRTGNTTRAEVEAALGGLVADSSFERPLHTRTGQMERLAAIDPEAAVRYGTRSTEANARARTARFSAQGQEARAEQEHQRNLQERNKTAQIRARTKQIETQNAGKIEEIEATRLKNAESASARLTQVAEEYNARTNYAVAASGARAAGQQSVILTRHSTAMEMEEAKLQADLRREDARVQGRKDVATHREELRAARSGGRGSGNNGSFMGRFFGGRLGNVTGSGLYAAGAISNELGTAGGKDAANMASVARGFGGLATGLELLTIAGAGTAAAIGGTVFAVTAAGVAMKKYNDILEKNAGLARSTGLYELGESPGAMGLGDVSMLAAGEYFPGLTAESAARFKGLGQEDRDRYGMMASAIMGQSPDFMGAESSWQLAQILEQQSFIARRGDPSALRRTSSMVRQASGAHQQAGNLFFSAMLRGDTRSAMEVMNMAQGDIGLGLRTGGSLDFGTEAGQQFEDYMMREYKQRTGREMHRRSLYDLSDQTEGLGGPRWIERQFRDIAGINPLELFQQREAYSIYGGDQAGSELIQRLDVLIEEQRGVRQAILQRTAGSVPSGVQ